MPARLVAASLLGVLVACDPSARVSPDASPADGGHADDAASVEDGGADAGPPMWPAIPPAEAPRCALRETTEFVLAGRLPLPVATAALLRVDGWLYVLPGESTAELGSDETWRLPVMADGTLGEVLSGPARPVAYEHPGRLVHMADRLYAIGGSPPNDFPVPRVLAGPLEADGAVRGWEDATPLVWAHMDPAAVVLDDVLLVLGGISAMKGATSSAVELAWVEGGALQPFHVIWRELTSWYGFAPGAARVGDYVYYASEQDALRFPVARLAEPEPIDPLRAPIGAHGRTLLLNGVAEVLRADVLEDGSVGEARVMAPHPPMSPGRHRSSIVGPSMTADHEYVYLLGGLGTGRWEHDYHSDEIWVAPLCAD